MGLVDYLGKMIELTDAELEIITKCPNFKYKTQSGVIVKGSDVKDSNVCKINSNNPEIFINCIIKCRGTRNTHH